MRKVKTIEELQLVTPEESKKFLEEAYIFVRITDEMMLTLRKFKDKYQFRELSLGYSEKTGQCTGYNCQYMNEYENPEEALSELQSRSNFLIKFFALNSTDIKLDGSVTRMVDKNVCIN